MKKEIVGILVCTLMISSLLASADVSRNNLGVEDDTITINIRVGRYEIKNTEQGNEIYVENFGRLLVPGKPNMPSKIFSIAIPPGAILTDFNLETGEGVVLDGSYYIEPVSIPIIIGERDPWVYEQMQMDYDENYQQVYGSDDPYPSSVVEFVGTGGYRKYNLVNFRVNPITYRPVSGQLIYYPEITVTASYTFPEGFTYGDIMVDNLDRAEQMAEKIVLNYDQATNWYPEGTIGRGMYDYVIITLDSLTSSVTSLVDWEEGKGRNVNVVTTSWINSNYDGYDLAEKIRNFLREKYPSEEWGIEDVCLVGHWDDVPIRTCSQYIYNYGPTDTDLYYAELSLPDSQSWDADEDHKWGENSDPIDFISEVNVGRIPWSNPSTVEDICDKTVAYEQTNDPEFKKNILLLGAFFWDNDPNPRTDNAVLMEAKVDQDWMKDWTMTRMYEEGYSTYPMDYDLTYNNVKTVWSQGSYGFVNWAGHGSPTACYRYHPSTPFVDTDTCNYLNDEYPAIIFADACSNSYTGSLNIGQAMLKQGAIGFLGSTEVAFGCPGWDDPSDGSSQSLDYFFTTCVTSGDYTQGQAHQWALYEMYTNGLWDYTKYEMFEWGALWGNPDLTMGIVSQPPDKPEIPDGPDVWTIGVAATFESTTTDPDEDSIYYLFDWGDGTDSGWVGPYTSGQTGQASHIWTELGDYQVKVMAKDEYGVQSDWSEPATISIVENEPPEPPIITGPEKGKTKKSLTFTFKSIDPEGHDLEYMIHWGDGHYIPYTGPYPSGTEVTFSHAWSEAGEFTIIAKARDQYGARSLQNTFKIKITAGNNQNDQQSSQPQGSGSQNNIR